MNDLRFLAIEKTAKKWTPSAILRNLGQVPHVGFAGGFAPVVHHVPDARLMRVKPCEQRRAGRAATRGVVKLREPHAALRQRVERGRRDLAPVAAEVGIADVVGHDEDDVRSWRGLARGGQGHQARDSEEVDQGFHKQVTSCFGSPISRWWQALRVGGRA